MAFRQLFNCSNNSSRVCNFQLHRAIRGRSTGQISLGKIVDTICSVSPPDDLEKSYSSPPFNLLEHGNKNNSDCALYGFDLNLPQGSYHSPPLPFADDCGTVEKSSVVERDLAEHEKSRREEESVRTEITGGEIFITTDPEAPPSVLNEYRILNKDNRSLIIPKGEGCLELLIEAAKLISGGFEDDLDTEPEEIRKGKNSIMLMQEGSAVSKGRRSKKRMREGEIENRRRSVEELRRDLDDDESVVVRRSRSGRCNVLPSKYRDSIVEPLCGQRSGTITAKRK